MIASKIVFFIEDSGREREGILIAEKLRLQLVHEAQNHPMALVLTSDRLELRFLQEKLKPIFIDFVDSATKQRLQKSQGRSELIARAVGIKGRYLPTIIDATAGLGVDAMILAHLGCQVQMVERSPIICALLEDGLKRLLDLCPPWAVNLKLYCEDAKDFLQTQILSHLLVDVVYLDPMFPERTKSALVKKEMRFLKNVVGKDEDAHELFYLAQQCAKKRIVIKRPLHAKTLVNVAPAIVYKGKACRFDVYFTGKD